MTTASCRPKGPHQLCHQDTAAHNSMTTILGDLNTAEIAHPDVHAALHGCQTTLWSMTRDLGSKRYMVNGGASHGLGDIVFGIRNDNNAVVGAIAS